MVLDAKVTTLVLFCVAGMEQLIMKASGWE